MSWAWGLRSLSALVETSAGSGLTDDAEIREGSKSVDQKPRVEIRKGVEIHERTRPRSQVTRGEHRVSEIAVEKTTTNFSCIFRNFPVT